jgi:glycine/D-amino acid oxidase-like deaminating enzyme
MTDAQSTCPSLWWGDATPDYSTFEGDLDADVVVIGGGVTGITLAYTLAEQGVTVGLLEAGELAAAASGRNAGFLTVAPAEPYQELIALWGRPGARAMLELGRRSHRQIRQLVQSLGIACDYHANGSLRLARSEDEADDLRASLPFMRADGFPMHEIALEDAVPRESASHFAAAFLTPEDGDLHPVRFLHALARAASQRGARIHARSRVESASWRGRLWEVRLGGGIARARTLVIATNAHASKLCPALTPLIQPRRGQMLATAPLGRAIAPRPTLARWGYQYWRQTPDQRLVIGGWRDLDLDGEVGFDERPTPHIQDGIETGLQQLVPEGTTIEHRWAGTMGFARDGRPLVGWLDAEHHLAICAGFTGHGMSMAAGCTLDLAELLSWRRAAGIATLDPRRFRELRYDRESIVALGAARS